jgi:hypothetical protein
LAMRVCALCVYMFVAGMELARLALLVRIAKLARLARHYTTMKYSNWLDQRVCRQSVIEQTILFGWVQSCRTTVR